jgi:guanosine-3',5'-bis(diphosphate) 3'-pyrophosphohydrolase
MDTALVKRARHNALVAHAGQVYPPRGSLDGVEYATKDMPFEMHLGHVIGVLHRFGHGCNAQLVAAAWLHDVLEDTQHFATVADVAAATDAHTAALVYAVTDEPGANRKERKARTYPKVASLDEAITLKLADRIANVESAFNGYSKYLPLYVAEHVGFTEALRPHGGDIEMWEYLGRLIGRARQLAPAGAVPCPGCSAPETRREPA